MPSIEAGLYQLGRLDELARGDSVVHRADPRVKVVVTLVYLVCVVSFGPYEILGLLPFALFPVLLAAEAGLPFRFLGARMLAAAPFALVVGAFNPLLDHTVLGHPWGIPVTGGWVSYASIVVRFMLTTSAALVLVATTSMNDVCVAMQKLGVPEVFATQLLFLYRYLFVLAEEVMRLTRARSLRSFRGRGMGMRVYGQILGHLLLRTVARASRVHQAMMARGFTGRSRRMQALRLQGGDVAFALGWTAAFVLFRLYDIPLLLGRLVTGGLQ